VATMRLDELHRTFHKRAIDGGDTEAAHVAVRASCELRAWLGIGGTNFDPVQLLVSSCLTDSRPLLPLAGVRPGRPRSRAIDLDDEDVNAMPSIPFEIHPSISAGGGFARTTQR
jgi:hypothetical protein